MAENKRAWLTAQGLAQGDRGRFSREAEAAWAAHLASEGIDVESVSAEPDLPRDGFTLAKVPVEYPDVRDEKSAYTVDEGGHLIGHSNCGKCKRPVSKCVCEGGPWGLSYVEPEQRAYLVKE